MDREETIHVIANKALTFLRGGYDGDSTSVRPDTRPQAVPAWIRDTDTFRFAARDGSVLEIEIKTLPASNSSFTACGLPESVLRPAGSMKQSGEGNDDSVPNDQQEQQTERKGRGRGPLLWQYFNAERTSTIYRELLFNWVSLSVPARLTNDHVVEQIARAASIPVESLSDHLAQSVFPRGQVVSGFAGDEFDKIADNYRNMQWWVSDTGLNMEIVSTPFSQLPRPSLSTRDHAVHEIVGEKNFKALTNREIMGDRKIGRELSRQYTFKSGSDATKSCFDRIRRAMGYPLSRTITNERSPQG